MKTFINSNMVHFDKWFFQPKYKNGRRNFLSVSLSIFVALLLSFIIITALGTRPESFFSMFTQAFAWDYSSQQFAIQMCTYTIAALAFSFCMKVGIFNIGISGQMLAGASTSFMVLLTAQYYNANLNLPGGQLLTLMLSILGSTAVALVIGVLKIYFKVNEVVSAILLNWIILLIVGAIITGVTVNGQKLFLDEVAFSEGTLRSLPLNDCFTFWNDNSFWGWPWTIAITTICVFVIWFILKFTVFGHKLKTTGQNPFAAENFGYSKNILQLSSFAISGILSGILATIVYTSNHTKSLDFDSVGGTALNQIPAQGFDGIAIGLIALNNPISIVFVSFVFSFPYVGAAPGGLPTSTIQLIMGVMMYIVAIYTLLNYLKIWNWYIKWKYNKHNYENYMNLENGFFEKNENYNFACKKIKNSIISGKIEKLSIQNKTLKLFVSYILKIYHSLTIPIFNKEYKVLVKQEKSSYNIERKYLINQFKIDCIIKSLDYWKHEKEIHKQNLEINFKQWSKNKKKICNWYDYVINSELELQLVNINEQFSEIEQKIEKESLQEIDVNGGQN